VLFFYLQIFRKKGDNAMLEHWYTERRTLVDFRRGPIGPYFDDFAGRLKEQGYSFTMARQILSKGCLFNTFLIENGITSCKKITPSLIESFLDTYLSDVWGPSAMQSHRPVTRGMLMHLISYLVECGAATAMKPKVVRTQYSWVLEPYARYLREECQLKEKGIKESRKYLCAFLEGLGEEVTRKRMRILRAETIETYVKQHLKDSPDNRRRLAAALRRFLRFCAQKGYSNKDLSGVIPTIPSYRLATLPKGMEDSALQRLLNVIPKDTPYGTRDYAIMLLMMAYGIRAESVAELLLEDISWSHSTIRIRARKGGKEVVVPLLDSVGEAILRYLHHRPERSPFREVFLRTRAPFGPLSGLIISAMIRKFMEKAGVKLPRTGSRTLRHSWAIRALAHDSPIKHIADVLGHRCLNSTFIYAKADLKTLRQVVMPWPEGR
jgi:integrase/recombinase XerD